MLKNRLKTFFKSELSIGVILAFATILSLLFANIKTSAIYQNFIASKELINDGLMSLFFLLVGLELKKEVLIGELSSRKKIALPLFAALGGIIFPALIFFLINKNEAQNLRGFAIPCATDIAFAYGIISFFGKKISNSLKIFLIALAILDDLAAILIIAVFYSHDLNFSFLFLALIPLALLLFLNLRKSEKNIFYLSLGFILWLLILKSGIHATLSGVVLALFIPLGISSRLAHQISPMVNFLILPLFAFVNAGVSLENFSLNNSLTLGIIIALFFGKQIGVMLFSFLAVKLRLASLPRGSNWFSFYGTAIFTGIGFTMSLFISELAFAANDQAKSGILIGSLLSMIFGSAILSVAKNEKT